MGSAFLGMLFRRESLVQNEGKIIKRKKGERKGQFLDQKHSSSAKERKIVYMWRKKGTKEKEEKKIGPLEVEKEEGKLHSECSSVQIPTVSKNETRNSW